MTWQEWAKQYLVEERRRKIAINELLSSGTIGLSEMRDGIRVDTAAKAIADNERHIAELEQILLEAGVPFDA